jgi:hypothetical protein
MASRPGVTVTISKVVLTYQGLNANLTASTPPGSSNYTLYVEVSGVHVDVINGEPMNDPHWSVARYNNDVYSIGHSYTLKDSYYYNIPISVSYQGCDCVLTSGPYVVVNALSLDPALLGSQQAESSGGISLVPVPLSGPFPGRAPGKYYATSLSSIADNEVDLDSWGIPTTVSVVKAYPETPANPYSNQWQWQDVTTASLTLQDLAKQNTLNGNWFYAGIFLGIAGSGVLALVPEVSEVLRAIHKDKKASRRRNRPPRRLGRRRSGPPVRSRAHRNSPNRSGVTRAVMVKRGTTNVRRNRLRGPHA